MSNTAYGDEVGIAAHGQRPAIISVSHSNAEIMSVMHINVDHRAFEGLAKNASAASHVSAMAVVIQSRDSFFDGFILHLQKLFLTNQDNAMARCWSEEVEGLFGVFQ